MEPILITIFLNYTVYSSSFYKRRKMNIFSCLFVDNISYYFAYTKEMIYDNHCSCALSLNCTTEAIFINKDSSKITPIPGLKMGCTPMESFLVSTLECFYNASCVILIQEQISSNKIVDLTFIPTIVLINSTRFPLNTTIFDFVKELFIETWLITTNYSAYFDFCLPTHCSYTYIQRLSSLYTITLLLSFFSALNFVFKWICPEIVHLVDSIYQYRKTRLISPHIVQTNTNTPPAK